MAMSSVFPLARSERSHASVKRPVKPPPEAEPRAPRKYDEWTQVIVLAALGDYTAQKLELHVVDVVGKGATHERHDVVVARSKIRSVTTNAANLSALRLNLEPMFTTAKPKKAYHVPREKDETLFTPEHLVVLKGHYLPEIPSFFDGSIVGDGLVFYMPIYGVENSFENYLRSANFDPRSDMLDAITTQSRRDAMLTFDRSKKWTHYLIANWEKIHGGKKRGTSSSEHADVRMTVEDALRVFVHFNESKKSKNLAVSRPAADEVWGYVLPSGGSKCVSSKYGEIEVPTFTSSSVFRAWPQNTTVMTDFAGFIQNMETAQIYVQIVIEETVITSHTDGDYDDDDDDDDVAFEIPTNEEIERAMIEHGWTSNTALEKYMDRILGGATEFSQTDVSQRLLSTYLTQQVNSVFPADPLDDGRSLME